MNRNDKFETGLGTFSRKKFRALTSIRANALLGFREALRRRDYSEVVTASLVNIAGSCENPYASFTLNYYGREAHLSQSAQLQLEALVIRLRQGFFAVNNSFREEDYNDPDSKGRRLSEFTLIEPEKPYSTMTPKRILKSIMGEIESVVKEVVSGLLLKNRSEIKLLGGDVEYLQRLTNMNFNILTYTEALRILNKKTNNKRRYKFGDDLAVKEEKLLLRYFNNDPVFVTYHPAVIKFFNMKRTRDGKKTYSVDLLLPRLGETVGGAVREEKGQEIEKYLLESKIGEFLRQKEANPLEQFREYLNIFKQEKPTLRGGYGVGFERFIGFLINSNDILDTLTYTGVGVRK